MVIGVFGHGVLAGGWADLRLLRMGLIFAWVGPYLLYSLLLIVINIDRICITSH